MRATATVITGVADTGRSRQQPDGGARRNRHVEWRLRLGGEVRSIEEPVTRCHHCGRLTARWLDYFCPECGEHHDTLYCAESPSGRTRSRKAIAEAEHLTAEVEAA